MPVISLFLLPGSCLKKVEVPQSLWRFGVFLRDTPDSAEVLKVRLYTVEQQPIGSVSP